MCGILAAALIVYRMSSTPEPQVRGVLNISSGVLGNLVSVSVSTSWGIWVSLIDKAQVGVQVDTPADLSRARQLMGF